MIDQTTIDRIVDAAQIQDVVGDFVTLRRRGANLIGLCPFHNEKTPSFSVSPAKGIYKCFGCGKGGNSVHFIMEHEQISYYEALKFLARKYHIDFQERELSVEELEARNDRESMLIINDFAQKHFSDLLRQHEDGRSIGMGYFRERNFRDDIILKFQLGYCLDQWDEFSKAAIKKGYNKEFLVKTGLSIENEKGNLIDRFRGRVMFPVHSLSGKVVAFGGRVLKKDDRNAKYVNSPESEIYHKSNELYGIFFAKQAIVKADRCFLVEGYTDVISMHQNGVENVVASSGTSLTPGQIRLIHRFTENVTVIYDGDAAGIKASLRGIDLLLEEGLNIKVLLLPDGDDPDSFAQKHNASDFSAYIENNSVDFIRFKTNLLLVDAGNDPIKKGALINDIVRSIAVIPNMVLRGEYVKECSALLHVEEQILYYEINKIKKNEKAKQNAQTIDVKNKSNAENEQYDSSRVDITYTSKYDELERNILQTLIKYGNEVLYYTDESHQTIMVADYIIQELDRDNLNMFNELHSKMYTEFKSRYIDPDFKAEQYFVQHQNINIATLTTDLVLEKYQLSKIHAKIKAPETEHEKLIRLVPRIVFEYKNSLILDMIKQKLIDLKIATEKKDNILIDKIMREMKQLDEVKKQLSKTLGERIIIKF